MSCGVSKRVTFRSGRRGRIDHSDVQSPGYVTRVHSTFGAAFCVL